MKRAVSISIGSSKRDKGVVIELLGETVSLERIGTDGDMQRAAALYGELDGIVQAFGVGGTDLGIMVGGHWYPLYSVKSLFRLVHQTPIVDGTGLKNTLEKYAPQVIREQIGDRVPGRKVFVVTAVDRWGLSEAFVEAGYPCMFGDMMFTLGIPMRLYTLRSLRRLAAILMPVAGRIPFKWVYPVGKDQEKRTPRWLDCFDWADIIAGDCHYITRYMPDRLAGKIIVTNTTTPEDKDLFCSAGVRYLVTTTPVLEGRSFGTNMMEAAITAATGRIQPVDYAHPGKYFEEIEALITRLGIKPQVQELN